MRSVYGSQIGTKCIADGAAQDDLTADWGMFNQQFAQPQDNKAHRNQQGVLRKVIIFLDIEIYLEASEDLEGALISQLPF